MKKFIYKTLLFFVLFICIDKTFGICLDYITRSLTKGEFGKENLIKNQITHDILIFGSSRAVHHYNPLLMQDSLGLSCYNCGLDGNGIILNFGRLLMCLERKHPKLIVYDITPEYDYFVNDNLKYLGRLKDSYDKDYIKDLFYDIDKREKVKMASQLYKHNSVFLKKIFMYLSSYVGTNDTFYNGFVPLHGVISDTSLNSFGREQEVHVIDSLKVKYLKKFVDYSSNSKLLFVYSPRFGGEDKNVLLPIMKICKDRGIAFYDFSHNFKFINKSIYFKDSSHLNTIGADLFTKDIIEIIKTEVLY